MAITESSITLNFPDNNFFRFADCQGYKDIQNNFKEMDACWYEQAGDTLYIIELKNWQDGKLFEENDPNYTEQEVNKKKEDITKYRINTLLKKSVDSLCIFMSILLEKPYSLNIQACSPFKITKTTKIKFLSIINWTNPDVTYISNVNTEYKSKFKPYAKLYGVQTYLVLTKNQASQTFDWVN